MAYIKDHELEMSQKGWQKKILKMVLREILASEVQNMRITGSAYSCSVFRHLLTSIIRTSRSFLLERVRITAAVEFQVRKNCRSK